MSRACNTNAKTEQNSSRSQNNTKEEPQIISNRLPNKDQSSEYDFGRKLSSDYK